MKISIAATNPCHLYPMAVALARRAALGCYYSGYPRWKLPAADQLPVRTHSARTSLVYAALKYLPAWARPAAPRLFTWQDRAFDRWVGRVLAPCDFIHAMPGQALCTFRRARQLGVRTVLNHATGPVRVVLRILTPEYARVGLPIARYSPFDDAYFARENEEYALADLHCVASRIVRAQLIDCGVVPEKILVVPYGADRRIFYPTPATAGGGENGEFRIVFAGQLCLRKDVRTLLRALQASGCAHWRIDFFGALLPEVEPDLAAHGPDARLHFHGPVAQQRLARAFREGSVLVLPSLEEGFGLVVPQALNCGLPCIVSDRVGAQDVIRHRQNGSIFPAGDPEALLEELRWWAEHPRRVVETLEWDEPARLLLERSAAI